MLPPAEPPAARGRRAAVLWAAITAALLLVPLPSPALTPPAWAGLPLDKLAHALLFFGLGRSWQRAWRAPIPARAGGLARRAVVAAAATAWGGLLELGQGTLGAGRAAEWGDLAADALGAVAAACLAGPL